MSLLLFLDESGHDHRTLPYEVHGGFALHSNKLWPFVQSLTNLEQVCFGDALSRFRTEIKGSKLLDKDRFRFAAQVPPMEDSERRRLCLGFLNKGLRKQSPTFAEFAAYGQACLQMVRGIFDLLSQHEAQIFASIVPRKLAPPQEREGILRKDIVFLLERYFYLLEYRQEAGLLVLDESEKMEDRRFVRRLERYFRETQTGRYRSARIVPSPFFVASDMAYPVQVADVIVYSVNTGVRLPKMMEPVRKEIADEFAPLVERLQWRGDGYRDGETYKTQGLVYVPDLYTARK
ncbi:MAG: hypothetical protein RIQ71_593 [Verrucomicrobiota bacterium]|jgi:hypothetical protein